MRLKIEEVEGDQAVLIVTKTHPSLTERLKEALERNHAEVFISPEIPETTRQFTNIFIIDDLFALHLAKKRSLKNCIFLTTALTRKIEIRLQEARTSYQHIKFIHLPIEDINEQTIEKVLWFSLSQNSTEQYLNLQTSVPRPAATHRTTQHVKHTFSPKPLIKSIVPLLITVVIIAQFIFIPFLAASSYFLMHAYRSIQTQDYDGAERALSQSSTFLRPAQTLYLIPRSILSVLSASLIPDNIMDLHRTGINTLLTALEVQKNGQKITTLLFQQSKTEKEQEELQLRITVFKQNVSELEEQLKTIEEKMPRFIPGTAKQTKKLSETIELLGQMRGLLAHSDSLFAKDGEKKYLLLFANNMELRPGGGFIGSFGIVKVKNFTIGNIQIYDVYDADGQLTGHIEPPLPLKKYLNVPHWFLRDSAFSADFVENYAQAKFFLDRELNERNFNGSLLLTTTAVQNILKAFGSIPVSDYNETINASNFYIKTQYYAEDKFFPGSTKKKSFLSSLLGSVLVNLETANLPTLLNSVKKSFDEKQMVFYTDDSKAQEYFDSQYRSGRIIEPQCSSDANCIVDYILPYDANVGVNKANFFVSRSMKLETSIDKDGTIKHTLQILLHNDSPAEVYPGGTYSNYFQVLLPKNSIVKSVAQNGTEIDEVNEEQDTYKKVGAHVEVAPKKSVLLEIKYSLPSKLATGKNHYQLVFQKQIGSANSDLSLDFILPNSIYISNQNFAPLVKNNHILYNTNLSADKLFIADIIRE